MFALRLFLVLLLCGEICFAYERPETVSTELWDDLAPYFLPENHPIKSKLDKIFTKKSVTRSSRTVLNAGFFNADQGKYSKTVVSAHFELNGYIVKMYLDSFTEINEGEKFKERVVGARAIKACIREFNLQDVLKVPKKWIYPIPEFSDSGAAPKHFVLIAEDMRPFDTKKTLSRWKSKITTRQLDAVRIVLDVVGLPDCAYAFNIPFCRDGKLAFLDTEYNALWPVNYGRMDQYLKGDMLKYWIKITR